ncbi:MAG: ABC transporter ATP-binding protein, partial [bacterium]|nr:ABC transporter ATP-binding protein [bacterium]
MTQDNAVIKIRNLEKSYEAGTQVLKGIDLDIYPGQIIGYIGPNGAGKSTTVKILTGILDSFQGQISVLGYDLATQAMEIKRRIGYVPENAAMYDTLTAIEYLGFIGRLYGMESTGLEKKIKNMLELFQLGDKGDMRMTSYSKGMRQKVLIIAGMLHDPDIIFLDEPLSGLDAKTAIVMKEILAAQA